MSLFQAIKPLLTGEKRNTILWLLIAIIFCSALSYHSYVYNKYMIIAEIKTVIIEDLNCYVRSVESSTRSEVYFSYQKKNYTTKIPENVCIDSEINNDIDLYYAKEIDEFGYTNQPNNPVLYISFGFLFISIFLFIKVVIK